MLPRKSHMENHTRWRVAGLVGFVMLQASTCPSDAEVALHRYALSACPAGELQFSTRAENALYRLQPTDRVAQRVAQRYLGPGAVAYKVVAVHGSRGNGLGVYARVNREAACSIDVAYSYQVGHDRATTRTNLQRRYARYIDAAAALLMQNSEVSPILPAQGIDYISLSQPPTVGE